MVSLWDSSPRGLSGAPELQDNVMLHFVEKGKDYWVYLENNMCFSKKPEIVSIGVMKFLKVEDIYMEMHSDVRIK